MGAGRSGGWQGALVVKTWWILLLLATVFGLVGVGLVTGAVLADGPLPLTLVGGLFALVGLGMGAAVPAVRRQQNVGGDEDTLETVDPASGRPAGPTPWPHQDVAWELARVFAGSPYVVQQTAGRIRVRADLADARFLSLAGAQRVSRVYAHDIVVEEEGRCATVDRTQQLRWSAGVDGAMRPRLAGSASVSSGKMLGKGSRREYGLGPDGTLGAQVDWTFALAEVQVPVREVLDQAGWKVSWPAEAKVAAAVALLGASSVVLVPLGFLVRWLSG